MDDFEQRLEQPKFSSLADVPAIHESRNSMVTKREQLKDLVEQPLLAACEELYDKNIRTLDTSANRENIETGEAYIIIDFDSLSEENRKVTQQYTEPTDNDAGKAVKITIPVTKETTPEEIEREAKRIVGTYQKQPATWIPTYTLEDIQRTAKIHHYENIPDDPEYWAKETGYFYDPESKKFYLSEEHYQKANEGNDAE